MSSTKILWSQIAVVFATVLITTWAATQWTAWRLGSATPGSNSRRESSAGLLPVVVCRAGTVLSYAILAEYFPTELAGRANAALNLFHIGGAFVVQYMTGVVVRLWAPIDGHYPEIAYQAAFAVNAILQVAAAVWFALALIPMGSFPTRRERI